MSEVSRCDHPGTLYVRLDDYIRLVQAHAEAERKLEDLQHEQAGYLT